MNEECKKTARTLAIYGDSISTRDYGEGGYEAMLSQQLKIGTVYNHSVGASAITQGTPDCLIDALADKKVLHSDADVTLLWRGTNDWYWGAPLGVPGDRNLHTFYGAVEECVRILQQASPLGVLLCALPLYRYQAPDGSTRIGGAWVTPNKRGLTMRDYDGALREVCRRLCVPVVDMRVETGINAANAPQLLQDFVHPSKQGYLRVCSVLCRHIKALTGWGAPLG